MAFRLLLVVMVLVVLGLASRLYRGWRAGLSQDRPEHPLVPAGLRSGADRTWVVFTTPFCASCGPVEERLRTADPDARVVRVDASREPLLADAFGIRRAPTALLADAEGRVRERLVGPEAVDRWARG